MLVVVTRHTSRGRAAAARPLCTNARESPSLDFSVWTQDEQLASL